ncbi:hypothetical protein [Reichenbachiella versicolor]|uniref:hypothetical protein n=1 Tax=Reichenbachiella versicolor TaxID=1821036 RepID=UPI0013A53F2F|nr:hypothetical protein [Reichenbachiella versicolor]
MKRLTNELKISSDSLTSTNQKYETLLTKYDSIEDKLESTSYNLKGLKLSVDSIMSSNISSIKALKNQLDDVMARQNYVDTLTTGGNEDIKF